MSASSKKNRAARRHAEPFTAVVDTNVIMEFYGCFDVFRKYKELSITTETLDDDGAVRRRARARYSFLLADYFHRIGAKTYSLRSELLTILTQRVPPRSNDPSGSTPEAAIANYDLTYTMTMVHVVKGWVFGRWREGIPRKEDRKRSNAADDALVAFAKRHNTVLVSNEKKELPRKGEREGIRVVTPRVFLVGQIQEEEAIAGLLDRYDAAAIAYLNTLRGAEHAREEDRLRTVKGYMEHVLVGTTNGREPVKVIHPDV